MIGAPLAARQPLARPTDRMLQGHATCGSGEFVETPEAGHSPKGAAQSDRRVRVLVVEDDDETRLMLREALGDEGFEVITAHDGAHALRIVAAGRPDVIVLDFDLPVVTGPEAVQVWRTRRPHDNIPVIGMSALREGDRVAQSLRLAGFLRKPFEIEALVSAIKVQVPGSIN